MAATIPTNGIALSSGLNVADGDVVMASGHGISFAATGGPTNTSELFDDYEEGQWSPVVRDGSNNATGNTFIGHAAGEDIGTGGNYNVGLGHSAGGSITSGDSNVAIGYGANSVTTTESHTVAVGKDAIPQNGKECRFGSFGGLKFYSMQITCDLGGTDENDPMHASAIAKIPRYSVITRASVVVTTRSSDANHVAKLVLSTDSSGTDNTALSGVQEVIGASMTECWAGTGDDGAAADIDLGSGATNKAAYCAVALGGDNSLSTLDTSAADLYLYMAFANGSHTNGDTEPSTAPVVRVFLEFAGQD